MPTQCNPALFDFAPIDGRAVVAAFDGGTITSDAGALLLGQADRAILSRTSVAGRARSSKPSPNFDRHFTSLLAWVDVDCAGQPAKRFLAATALCRIRP